MKRPGYPGRCYLDWTVTKGPHIFIHISKPQLFEPVLAKSNMEHANQLTASLLNKPDFDIDSTAEPLNKIQHQQYRSVIGDL